MVDGLKLLVTDGRIILVILQEKAKKTFKTAADWKSRNPPAKDPDHDTERGKC